MTSQLLGPATIILAVTAGVSLLGLYRMPGLIDRFVMRPYQVARGRNMEAVVTSGFVNGDLQHLLFNLVTFYFFAFPMERFLGPTAFSVIYALGLVVSIVKACNEPESSCYCHRCAGAGRKCSLGPGRLQVHRYGWLCQLSGSAVHRYCRAANRNSRQAGTGAAGRLIAD